MDNCDAFTEDAQARSRVLTLTHHMGELVLTYICNYAIEEYLDLNAENAVLPLPHASGEQFFQSFPKIR